MSSYRKKSDWGCLGWFLLAFAVLCLILLVIILATTPSGGGAGPCQSLANNDRLGKGNSTAPVKHWQTIGGVTQVSSPVGTTGGSGGKPSAPRPAPVKPVPAPKPVLPNKGQPTAPNAQKPPQGGSGGSYKAPKVDIDLVDCD